MRHLVLTIVAIAIAGIAAVAATTAMLNSPLRIGPAAGTTPTAQPGQTSAPADPAAKPAGKPDTKETPDGPAPKGASPQASAPAGTEPAGTQAPAAGETPEESDKDPYDGIAPEDLPPDLQYDADASVSFPTNT